METLFTSDEAARQLGLHPKTLPNWRHQHRGPAFVRLGRAIRYPESALLAYLQHGEPAASVQIEPLPYRRWRKPKMKEER